MSEIRIDKLLSEMNYGTRREIKDAVKSGRISVDGLVIKKSDLKIDPSKTVILYDKKKVVYSEFEYYMLYKPSGVVSATKDNHYKTVIDLIDCEKRKDLFPVGRLDIDTEGLLFITNDGELAHNLLAPTKHVAKTYYAEIDGTVTNTDAICFENGIEFEKDTISKPACLEILESASISRVYVTIAEGKFHQIKKMFQALDKKVVFLKRITMAGISLDEKLSPGEYRRLTDEEIKKLKNPPRWRNTK